MVLGWLEEYPLGCSVVFFRPNWISRLAMWEKLRAIEIPCQVNPSHKEGDENENVEHYLPW
jgi:hypothetical protein